MGTKIRFLGFAAFEITTPDGKVILIDPYLEENPVTPVKVGDLERVDLILVTHLAADHLGDAAQIASKFDAPVICGPEVKVFLEEEGLASELITAVPWGVLVKVAGIQVRAIECHHTSFRKSPSGQFLNGPPLSFIVTTEPDVRIYHSGDSALFSDMKLIGKRHQPTVGLMCACKLEDEYMASLGLDAYKENEMSGVEGALAASWLGVETAVICHYMDPTNKEDVVNFFLHLKNMAKSKQKKITAIAPMPGETLAFP